MSNKSLVRSFCEVFTGKRIRVAIIGSRRSGKTVFLTSLCSNLYYPNKNFCSGWLLRAEKTYESEHPFRYDDARELLAHGQWPKPTTDWSFLRIPITLTKGKERKLFDLEFLDVPGERVADFPMIGNDYAEWCKWFDFEFGAKFKDYAKRLFSCKSKEDAFQTYRDFLANEFADHALSLTPSVVLLDENGRGLGENGRPKTVKEAILGVDAEHQFIPLPPSFLKPLEDFDEVERKKWVKEFSINYSHYKKRIVAPLARRIRGANVLLYLVDVIGLLQRGADAYSSELKFGEAALEKFVRKERRNPVLRALKRTWDFFLDTKADRFGLIATQSDRVGRFENRDKLKTLLREMFKHQLGLFPLHEVMSCASVVTADGFEDDESKVRIFCESPKSENDKPGEYEISKVPRTWPKSSEWKPGDDKYNFPQTFPSFDLRVDMPPRQLGLDLIFWDIILGVKNKG